MEQEITHPIFGYKIRYRRVLEVQARLLSRVLLGELAEYLGRSEEHTSELQSR